MFRESRDADSLTVSTETDDADLPLSGEARKSVAAAPPLDGADTVGGGIAGAGSLVVGASVDVVIETLGDHDWYAVTLASGTTYTFHTTFDATSTDAFLILRDAGGAEIVSDDDSGERNNSLIGFTPGVTGTYYIDAGTFEDDTTGSFHLSLASVLPPGDSVLGSTATSATLGVTGSVDGNIDSAGDHDFYRIALTAGQTYIFHTGGTLAYTVTDTRLTLRDASGAQLLTNNDAGEGTFSAIRYTAPTTGNYYLDVSGSPGVTGAFNLTAFTTPAPVLFTYDQIASQLTDGYWHGFSHHFAVTTGGSLTFNVAGLTAAGQTLAREALAIWSDVTGIAFNEVVSGGQIVYDDEEEGAHASASYGDGITSSADVNVSSQWLTDYGTGLNSYSFQAYIHETGHALGLGHAGNYNTTADYGLDSLYLNDSWATTVMSYFDQTENTYFDGLGFSREFVVTPMVGDGVAVANLYGAAATTRTGNTTYGFNNTSGRAIYDAAAFPSVGYAIFDNGGNDTLDYSGFSANQAIDLNPEAFSDVGGRIGNVTIARGTVIENAIGGPGNDTITGNGADNVIKLNFGGTDTVYGGAGNDGLYFGAALTAADTVDGGAGTLDQLGLQGNYGAPYTFSASNLVNIEQLVLLSGDDTRFGDDGTHSYDYTLKTIDANLGAGQQLVVTFNSLKAGEDVTFDGSAETDGYFFTYGGLGTDHLTGGLQDDRFYFGNLGRWGSGDSADGQAGALDQVGLQGDYSGASAVTFGPAQLSHVDMLVLLTGGDTRFGNLPGVGYSYTVTMADANVAAGEMFYVSANTLRAGVSGVSDEVLRFDGSAETSGRFTIYSGAGNDTIVGGASNDTIYGAGGADQLTGGAGNDVFAYINAAHSTSAAQDGIHDFALGDLIDLSVIDADTGLGGNQAFGFIGNAAFGGHAGELRFQNVSAGGAIWIVQGDTDGNGASDFEVVVVLADAHPLTGADFVL
jgi:hypothetical protein